MSQADPRIKQIKINTGVVTRIAKEKKSYEKESVSFEGKVEKMKADGKDEHDLKKQIECLNESRAMIPDCQRRLKDAYEKLSNMLTAETDLAETEEYIKAQESLKTAKSELPN